MRIVIDLQGAQCGSRHRGIGRYSLALAKAMVRNRGDHEIIIVLSGFFTETIEPIRAEFDGLLSQENIRVWHAYGPVDSVNGSNTWRRNVAEFIRESFLSSLQPDIVHVSSFFEGFYDNSVGSIGLYSKNIPTAVTFYDLIPLIQHELYLTPNPDFEIIYREKINQLRRSDLYLAISESSRQELIEHLSIQSEKVFNISTAAGDQFKSLEISLSNKTALCQRFGLNRPFIMYSGATDPRKNHLRLIKAFSMLKPELRGGYQLAIVGKLPDADRVIFEEHVKACGLTLNDITITGGVSDSEMAQLYNLCNLFVFPSLHEGFGLPALEAMSCGAPVIGSNTTSVPEVIGRADALFDPYDEKSISEKITQCLTDDDFRADLSRHGLEQAKAFSWHASANRAIAAFEQFHAQRKVQKILDVSIKKHRLAFVSPLPPERSGISDYSAELLPELSNYYDIDVIVDQKIVLDSWITSNCSVRDVDWFENNFQYYDRVIYQFGNSHFHQHMFGLLKKIPGVVVLHDFFLSGIVAHMDHNGLTPNGWLLELYHAHGYKAFQEHIHSKDWNNEIIKYPCNRTVLENSIGVIVHSDHSRQLGDKWFGKEFSKDWSIIKHARVPEINQSRGNARQVLGFDEDAFVISSFGILAPTKQNQRLLDAWLDSPLSKDDRCWLVFVGENPRGDYGDNLIATINNSGLAKSRIRITGWTDTSQFRNYLAASDVGVQLRTLSRGESSGTVLDCMNYGLATIVNAHGAMADLPEDAVLMLRENFENFELSSALENLWIDEKKRKNLGMRAREVILNQHAPQSCAYQYAQSIEHYFKKNYDGENRLIDKIGSLAGAPSADNEWLEVANSISRNKNSSTIKQLLVDVSALINNDLKTGIERVVRSALFELINNPPEGFRVEPVYASAHELGYRYARQFTLGFLDCPDNLISDDVVEAFNGDVFLGLDLQQQIVAHQSRYYENLRQIGVRVYFVVYDLLPVLRPDVFPEGASTMHAAWLNTIQKAHGAICISRAVADEMVEWLSIYGSKRFRPFRLGYYHLGADVKSSVPSRGLPANAKKILATISRRPTFLMVGTIEPRKGHLQTLAAFEKLWAQGVDVNLIIVGSEGWKGLPERQKRTIPLIVHRLLNNTQLEKRLFWLEGVSDEFLESIYSQSSCLVAASEGEGFGLPLIEAAQHKLSIIARDIPIFREVLGEHAFYFSGLTPDALADSVQAWLALDKEGQAPQSDTMPWLTWKQSTQNLLDVMLGNQWYKQWMPDDVHRFWGGDARLDTQVGKRTGRDIESTGEAGYLIFGPYIRLDAGQYRVVIRGVLGEKGLAGAHMDAVVDKGRHILDKSALNAPDEKGNFVELFITLDAPCTDLEVRVWVSSDSDLKVSMIEIAPWHSEQEASGVDSEDRIESNVAEPIMDLETFATIGAHSDLQPAPESVQEKQITGQTKTSNDASVLMATVIPSDTKPVSQPSSAVRKRVKSQRKKMR